MDGRTNPVVRREYRPVSGVPEAIRRRLTVETSAGHPLRTVRLLALLGGPAAVVPIVVLAGEGMPGWAMPLGVLVAAGQSGLAAAVMSAPQSEVVRARLRAGGAE